MSPEITQRTTFSKEIDMFKRSILLAFVIVAMLAVTGIVAAQDATVTVGPITKAVMDRGELICGPNKAGLAGFATVNDAGDWQGFDVDICRAVAAAILGDATK